MAEEPCSICGGSKDDHEQLNHEHNLHNQLISKVHTKKRDDRRQLVPSVIGGIDLDLRHILLTKGIITNEDFAALRHPGNSVAGDREAGEAPGSE